MDTSVTPDIMRWKSTVIYLVMFTLSTAVNGQSVRLDRYGAGSVSTCSSGLRDGIDFYVFRGIVDATVAKYSNMVYFQIRAANSYIFEYLCVVSLISCTIPNPLPCYCAVRKGYIYEIVANISAVLADSEASIRIQWNSSSGASVISDVTKVSKIYDINDVRTNLTLNDTPMTCQPGQDVKAENGSVINFECHNSPSRCEVSITVNNELEEKRENIVKYTVVASPQTKTVFYFSFSYSVCEGSPNIKSCRVIIGNGTNLSERCSVGLVVTMLSLLTACADTWLHLTVFH